MVGSTVGRGRSPVLTRCWFTAARVALVIVSIICCAGKGENPRLPYAVHVARAVPKRGCELVAGGGLTLGGRRGYMLFEGGTVALCHRLDLGRGKNEEKLAGDTDSRCRSLLEHPS